MATTMAMTAADTGPWGRFALVSTDHPAESDHVYFSLPQHWIGRSAERCDVVLDLQYISSVHCVVALEGRTPDGSPIVRLEDKSRNGVWVNGDRVGKGNSARLDSGFTVHFTRPGLRAAGVDPRIYKFEALPLESETKPEAANITQDLNASVLGSPQSTRLLPGGSPSTKKRRRSSENIEIENEDPRDARIRELTGQLKDAASHLEAVTEAVEEANAKHELVLEKAAVERHELVGQVKALTTQRQQLTANAEELAAKLRTVEIEHEQQLITLQRQLTERDAELDALKTECDAAKRALEETDALLNERNKQLVALKAEGSELMTRLVASGKQADGGQSTAGDDGDSQQAVKRQRQLEETVASLRLELDASRRRANALEVKTERASVGAAASDQSSPGLALALANQKNARLQRKLMVASGLFKQLQLLSEEGGASLQRTDEGAVDDGVAAASSALGLLRGDRPAEVVVNAEDESVVAQRGSPAADADMKSEGEASAGVEDMDVEPSDEAQDAVETQEQTLPETEATKAHESEREVIQLEGEGEGEHQSDLGSDKSSGSRSTTLGSGDADTE